MILLIRINKPTPCVMRAKEACTELDGWGGVGVGLAGLVMIIARASAVVVCRRPKHYIRIRNNLI